MKIFSASYLLSMNSPPLAGGGLVVDKGRIIAVGTLTDLRAKYHGEVRDFPGMVIMPGLVNAHSHLELTHFPAWKIRKGLDYSPRSYADWVVQVIKVKRGVSSEELLQSLREGLWKALESGTTTIGEIVTDRSMVNLYINSPLSGRLYLEAIGHEPGRCDDLAKELARVLDDFEEGRFLPGLSPHAPHTLARNFMLKIGGMAAGRGLSLMIHLAESAEEVSFMHDSTGRIAELIYPMAGWNDYLPPPQRTSSTAYLDSLGLLNPATTVVHAVHVTPADIGILKERGVSVVLCPRSNDRLDVGRAPAGLLKKSGIRLALGTDSLASNDSLSLWDEMRFLRREFPGTFTPDESLAMVTIEAARSLQVEELAGSIVPGKPANLLVMQTGHLGRADELAESLIEEGRVEAVFVSGEQQV